MFERFEKTYLFRLKSTGAEYRVSALNKWMARNKLKKMLLDENIAKQFECKKI